MSANRKDYINGYVLGLEQASKNLEFNGRNLDVGSSFRTGYFNGWNDYNLKNIFQKLWFKFLLYRRIK